METRLNNFLPDASAPETQLVASVLPRDAEYKMIHITDIREMIKPRAAFSHKGSYGHALIIAGAPNTMGAALLASKGCLYAGAGLITAAIPESGLTALNSAIPEVMYATREDLLKAYGLEKYDAIAIGPGISVGLGNTMNTLSLMQKLIEQKFPIVADADALKLIADAKLQKTLSKGTILTPHVKEFDRLFGKHETWWDRLQTARDFAKKRGVVIVLKNQNTFIIDQAGTVHINPTGNPAMAQGGMGDVLTGVITAYVAHGYTPVEAAILGCYVHGKAGDELSENRVSVTASQVAKQLPKTVKRLGS